MAQPQQKGKDILTAIKQEEEESEQKKVNYIIILPYLGC